MSPGQPEKVAIFCYGRGAMMDYDFLAPARRVFVCLDPGLLLAAEAGRLLPGGRQSS
jgi:hypothetical protein